MEARVTFSCGHGYEGWFLQNNLPRFNRPVFCKDCLRVVEQESCDPDRIIYNTQLFTSTEPAQCPDHWVPGLWGVVEWDFYRGWSAYCVGIAEDGTPTESARMEGFNSPEEAMAYAKAYAAAAQSE